MGGRVVASAVIGGTTSVIAGGKFANGAVTAAFSYAFNELAHASAKDEDLEVLNRRAQDIAYKSAGRDGFVDLSQQELVEAFRYEFERLNGRSNAVGGYGNMSDVDFLLEARNEGDSWFYNENGGRQYRIDGAGPYLGGNINYINQGIIFALGGRTLAEARMAVFAWNASGAGHIEYLSQRLQFTEMGYYMFQSKGGGGW
jgi:hypothetical protein